MKVVKGFTVVELIAVIVLTGILAAVAIPKFFSKDSFDNRFFFDDAFISIRYARQLAVAKGCHVQFTISSSRFVLNSDSQCGTGAISFTGIINRPGTDDVYENTDVPTGTSTATWVFDPEGQAGQVSSGSFSMFGSTQTINIGSFSVQVDGPTGFSR